MRVLSGQFQITAVEKTAPACRDLRERVLPPFRISPETGSSAERMIPGWWIKSSFASSRMHVERRGNSPMAPSCSAFVGAQKLRWNEMVDFDIRAERRMHSGAGRGDKVGAAAGGDSVAS